MLKHYKNLNQIITLQNVHKKNGRRLAPDDLSIINSGSIVFDDSKIIWIGPSSDLPEEHKEISAEDKSGHILMPEIVDSHTHLVFAGDRSLEYGMRLNGASYEEIAKAGGGILNTTTATRNATLEELFELGKKRIEKIYSYGVGTIEIKSGYGLTYESEKLITEVIHKLKLHFSGKVQIINTFMAAHAIPKEFSNAQLYIKEVVIPLMQNLQSSIDFVDIFHEQNYFDDKDVQLLFEAAQKLNLKTKIHADELNDNNGAALAVKYNSTSADHLLCISDNNISKIANAKTVATLLPGTALFLGKPLPPARKLLDAGAQVAMASDYNPGSCHVDNLPLLASITGKNLNMNLCEITASITYNAASALSLENQGHISIGAKPRYSIFKCNRLEDIFYNWGSI